jgi:ribosome biogenesis GTPase
MTGTPAKDATPLTGLVIRGSRNIFTVRLKTGEELECRLKGKVLKGSGRCHNPLAPGDAVTVEADPAHPGTGLVLALEKRSSIFTRLNQQGLDSNRTAQPQLLAANVDMVICVTTPSSPPFRPRFIDRVLLQADAAGIEALIVCSKWDLFDANPDIDERLEDYKRIGYEVFRLSSLSGEGTGELRSRIDGCFSVLVGQSGVGKSSLIKALAPGLDIRVGCLNEKYDRGSHTTTLSTMIELPRVNGPGPDEGGAVDGNQKTPGRTCLIDTPGIRLFNPEGISRADVIFHMREFAPLAGTCTFGFSCSHETEPGCKIMEAVAAGVIHEDRYESFLRIREDLPEKNYGN